MSSMTGNMGMRGGPSGSGQGNKMAGYDIGQMQNFDPQQMQLYKQLFSNLGPDSQLSRLAAGDEGTFQQMEAPAMRQFGEMQGDIASRFSGMGMGARKGSGFKNSMNKATSNFAQDLASRRQDLQRQALQDLMGFSNTLLGQRPNENFLVRPNEQPSFGQQILGGALPIAGAAIGGSYGGVPGATAGYQAGSAAGQAFFQ